MNYAKAALVALLGVGVAWAFSSVLSYELEAPEIRNYVPGKPLFDKPVTGSYARVVSKQLEDKLNRESVLRRAPWPEGALVRGVAFFIDPINLAIVAAFAWAAWRLYIRKNGTGKTKA